MHPKYFFCKVMKCQIQYLHRSGDHKNGSISSYKNKVYLPEKKYFTVLSEIACCWFSPTLSKNLKNHNSVIQLLENFKVNFHLMKFDFLRNLLSTYVSMFQMANGNLLLWSTLLLIQHYKCT